MVSQFRARAKTASLELVGGPYGWRGGRAAGRGWQRGWQGRSQKG